jgi:hypothetical protein
MYELTIVACLLTGDKCLEYHGKHPYFTPKACDQARREAIEAGAELVAQGRRLDAHCNGR